MPINIPDRRAHSLARLRSLPELFEPLLIIATASAALWFSMRVLDIFTKSPFTDFDILFNSAYSLATGHSPYNIDGLRLAPFGPYYKFPPLVDIVLAQFAQLNWHLAVIQVARIYAALGLVLYAASYLILVITTKLVFRTPPFYLLTIGFLVFQPSLDTLYGAQHEFVILFLLSVAYWGLHHNRYGEWIAGASIATVSLIKIYPILLAPYFLLRRAWNAAAALVISIAMLTLISIALAGVELQKEFWLGIFPALSGGTAWLENQSFFGFFARLFVNGATVNPALVTPLPIASILSSLATVLSLLISLFVLWIDSSPEDAFATLIPLMLLISPNSWIHYETVLLLPFAILLSLFSRSGGRWNWIVILLAVVLVAFGNEDTVMSTSSGLLQSYKFIGVFLIWSLSVAWAWRHRAQTRGETGIRSKYLWEPVVDRS